MKTTTECYTNSRPFSNHYEQVNGFDSIDCANANHGARPCPMLRVLN